LDFLKQSYILFSSIYRLFAFASLPFIIPPWFRRQAVKSSIVVLPMFEGNLQVVD